MKLAARIFIVLLFIFQGDLFAQSKHKIKLCEAINSMADFQQLIGDLPSYAETDSIENYEEIALCLNQNSKTLDEFISISKQVHFCHFFRPKVHHNVENLRATLTTLKKAIQVHKVLIQSIPKANVIHIIPDSIPTKYKYPELNSHQDNISDLMPHDTLRPWKESFDPWMNAVYTHDIVPSIKRTSLLPLIIEYDRFIHSLSEMKSTLPKRWKKKWIKE